MSALLHLFNVRLIPSPLPSLTILFQAKLAIGTHVVADKDLPSNQEHLPFPNPNAQIEFYKKFKREADEYDNDFVKKYNDEADTTLIFVSFPLHSFRDLNANLDISWGIGWSVLCSRIRFHYRRSESTSTGLHANELRSP